MREIVREIGFPAAVAVVVLWMLNNEVAAVRRAAMRTELQVHGLRNDLRQALGWPTLPSESGEVEEGGRLPEWAPGLPKSGAGFGGLVQRMREGSRTPAPSTPTPGRGRRLSCGLRASPAALPG